MKIISRHILLAAVAISMCSGQWAIAAEFDQPTYRVSDPMEFELTDEGQAQADPAPDPDSDSMLVSQSDLVPSQESPSDVHVPPEVNQEPAFVDQILSTSPGQVDVGTACCESGCGYCRPSVPNMLGNTSLGAPLGFNSGGLGGQILRLDLPFARVATNNNVMPQTRFGVTYHHYEKAPRLWDIAGNVQRSIDIDEAQFHFEKSFCCDAYSLSLNVPIYHTVDFEQNLATWGATDAELGNISIGAKAVVYEGCNFAVSAGLLAELPTTEDHTITGATTQENDAWYFTPYVGMQYTPNDCWFAHGFASYRFRADDLPITGSTLHAIDPNRLMLDAGVGYWLFRDCCNGGLVTGLAPTAELHYTTYTERQDHPNLYQAIYFDQVDYLNLTLGATAELCTGGSLATGLMVSLRDNTLPGGTLETDRPYDWGFILQYNQRF